MEHSRFSLLPQELLLETLTYSDLEDIRSFFRAYNIKPTQKQLAYIAERFELPYAVSIDVLLSHNSHTIEKRIEYCIENNDAESLSRLIVLYDNPLDNDFLDKFVNPYSEIYFDDEYPNVGRIVLLHEIDKNGILSYKHLILAIRIGDKELIKLIVENRVDFSIDVLSESVPYLTVDLVVYILSLQPNNILEKRADWVDIYIISLDYDWVEMVKYIVDNQLLNEADLYEYLRVEVSDEMVDVLYPVLGKRLVEYFMDISNEVQLLHLVNKVGKKELLSLFDEREKEEEYYRNYIKDI